MKEFLIGLSVFAAIGCHAQVPSNPTVYTCPASSGTAYTPLNQASPATGLTYTDSKPASGEYCYIVQSVVSSTGQISIPSNVAGPVALDGVKSTLLSWSAPTTGPAPTGYVISRAPALASTLGAPALTSPSVAGNSTDPGTSLAMNLTARVR